MSTDHYHNMVLEYHFVQMNIRDHFQYVFSVAWQSRKIQERVIKPSPLFPSSIWIFQSRGNSHRLYQKMHVFVYLKYNDIQMKMYMG